MDAIWLLRESVSVLRPDVRGIDAWYHRGALRSGNAAEISLLRSAAG